MKIPEIQISMSETIMSLDRQNNILRAEITALTEEVRSLKGELEQSEKDKLVLSKKNLQLQNVLNRANSFESASTSLKKNAKRAKA
jgi:hypothetical protein